MSPLDIRQQPSGIADTTALVLALPLAGGALCFVSYAPMALVLFVAWVTLSVSRLRRSQAESEAQFGLAEKLERAQFLLQQGAHGASRSLARQVADEARTPETQRAVVETLAWCELGLGRPEAARAALSCIPVYVLDPYCRAAVAEACGHAHEALGILQATHVKKPLSRPAIQLQIELKARLHGAAEACECALQNVHSLTREDIERVLNFAGEARTVPAAQALTRALQNRDRRSASGLWRT